MKNLFFLIAIICSLSASAQISRERLIENAKKSVQKQFRQKKLEWSSTEVFIRAFKHEKKLQVWVKPLDSSQFVLLKTYDICQISGKPGPKRKEGDLQVPEGFYWIDEYNAYSKYHMSLGISYPNKSDRILSKHSRKGGSIYVHGNCVSVGCIAIGNKNVEELYVLAKMAEDSGNPVQIHIFPIDFDNPKSVDYLTSYYASEAASSFFDNLAEGFFYFQVSKQLPMVTVGENGKYLFK